MQNKDAVIDTKAKKRKREQITVDLDNVKPNRGGCLISFLALHIGFNGIVVITMMGKLTSPQLDLGNNIANTSTAMYIFIASVFVGLISAIGLWNWKKWAYYGMMLSFGISLVAGFYTNSMIDIVRSTIWISLLYFLAKPIKDHLE